MERPNGCSEWLMHFSLGWCRDVALYALGVGACNADAADEKELQLVYHRDGQSSIKVLKMSWWGCVRLIFFFLLTIALHSSEC